MYNAIGIAGNITPINRNDASSTGFMVTQCLTITEQSEKNNEEIVAKISPM